MWFLKRNAATLARIAANNGSTLERNESSMRGSDGSRHYKREEMK
jgi:hypothetical protein